MQKLNVAAIKYLLCEVITFFYAISVSSFYLDWTNYYRVFSHDVTAAILVSQNNETAAMLVSQTNPVGIELFSYANAFFCSNKFAYMLATWVKRLYRGPYSGCQRLFMSGFRFRSILKSGKKFSCGCSQRPFVTPIPLFKRLRQARNGKNPMIHFMIKTKAF